MPKDTAIAVPFKKSKESFALIHGMTRDLFPDAIPFVQYMLGDDGTILAVSPAPCPIPDTYEAVLAAVVETGAQFNTWVDETTGLLHMTVGEYPDARVERTIPIPKVSLGLSDHELGLQVKDTIERLLDDAYLALVAKH